MQRWITGGLVGLFVAGMFGAALTQTRDQTPTTKADTRVHKPTTKLDAQEAEFARQVVDLTNRERARYKLAPLTLQKNLSAAAHWMARDLAQNPNFSHTDRQGRNIAPRLESFDYTNWHTIGENIAAGQSTPEKVVESWMHSPGHRENILRASFREIGIGYYVASRTKYKRYWVQDFGSRF